MHVKGRLVDEGEFANMAELEDYVEEMTRVG